jgi:3-oxoacyl-[acyl-carrier protein] reductase
LINLTESIAAEVKEYRIDVNCICPGTVFTEGLQKAFGVESGEDNPRMMLPEEIAAVAMFLASDDSSSITGAAIDAFGGSNPLFG